MEPRKTDPWEARDRDRAKREAWRQGKKRPSPSAQGNGSDPLLPLLGGEGGGFDFQNNVVPVGLLVALVLLLLASLPFDGLPAALAYRSFFTKAGSILLLFIAIIGGGNVGRGSIGDLRRGPHPFLLLLLLWTAVSLVLAPFKGYAVLEFVRIIDGVAAYFIAGYALKNGGKQAANLVVGLLGLGCVLSLAQIAEIGQTPGGFRAGIIMSRLGAHGNIGSVLLLLWPPALALAVWPGMEDKRRIAALAASLIIGCALLAERARSSWIGAVAAVLVLAACYFLAQKNRGGSEAASPTRRAHQNASPFARAVGSPFVLLFVGLLLFLAFGGGAARLIAGRAASIGNGSAANGSTFQSRLVAWGGAARMASDKPVMGWGLGTYPVLQGRWTHLGAEVDAALQAGADNLSLAHNYYLQWAADTGYTGLFLYVAFVAAYVAMLWTKLPHLHSPFHQALLSGVLATVVSSHVDALASPAHHFHGVWVLLWAWMGLGLAALRPAPTSRRTTAAEDAVQIAPLVPDADSSGSRTILAVWGSGAVLGGVAVVCVAAFAARLHMEGQRVGRGNLEVVANGNGAAQAGATLSWTARFHNEKGQSLPTSPGTTWSLQTTPATLTQAAQLSLYVPPSIDPMDLEGAKRYSEFRALVPVDAVTTAAAVDPKNPPQVTVKATYFDAYGRKYEAWSIRTLAVKPSK